MGGGCVCGVWEHASLPMSDAHIVPTALKSMISKASFSSLMSCFEKLKLSTPSMTAARRTNDVSVGCEEKGKSFTDLLLAQPDDRVDVLLAPSPIFGNANGSL